MKKRAKSKKRTVWSAYELQQHISEKFSTENDKFWKWVFKDTKLGDIIFLDLADPDLKNNIKTEFHEYIDILKDEFFDENIDYFEIENDLI